VERILPAFRVGASAGQWPGFLTSARAQQVPGGRGGAAVGRGQPVAHAMHPQAQILKSTHTYKFRKALLSIQILEGLT